MTRLTPQEVWDINEAIKNHPEDDPDIQKILNILLELAPALPIILCDSVDRIEKPVPAQEAKLDTYLEVAQNYVLYRRIFLDREHEVVMLDAKRHLIKLE